MSVDNVTIPTALLNHWGGPKDDDSSGDANQEAGRESFDVTKVAAQAATQVHIEDHQPSVAGNEVPRSRRRGNTLDGVPASWMPSVPPRSRTISLGGPGRPRAASQPTLANPVFQSRVAALSSIAEASRPSSKQASSEQPRTEKPIQRSQPSKVLEGSDLENTYVFQSLNNFTFPGAGGPHDPEPVVFAAGDAWESEPSQFQTRPSMPRDNSEQSRFSTQTLARRASVLIDRTVDGVQNAVAAVLNTGRKSSVAEMYEKAKVRQVKIKRSPAAQYAFEYFCYLLIVAFIYFVFVGRPLWDGVVWYIYIVFMRYLVVPAGTAAFLGIGFLYAYLPLLISFEKSAPIVPQRPMFPPHPGVPRRLSKNNDTALLIPCYKSENLIAATLEAALKIFPPESIFVIANGNSPTPLDNTASVCEEYGVSHTWSPLGSKIIAQFVGTYVAKNFPYVLLIDDDCLLPPNFPLVTERLRGKVQCIGYTIKSVGPNRSKGTLCQQAQDVEYKLSGIQRAFAGKLGSATFPHGAISIWDRKLLIKTFQEHPGFSVSEDWFFGHVARQLGCRIQMCTSCFVETETPSAIFFSSGGARGGFGEMTIWKQRFFRWNFFFVNGMYYDMAYILKNWRLGWWEIGAKIFVFQEVYETLLYLLAPFVLPISFIVRPAFSAYLFAATLVLYFLNVIIFNYVHLRSRGEMVSVVCLLYYMPYKIILTFVNIASCYYSIYKYAKYFAKRHAKVVEDENAVAIVLKLEENETKSTAGSDEDEHGTAENRPRHFSITAVGTTLDSALRSTQTDVLVDSLTEGVQVVDFAASSSPRLHTSPEPLSNLSTPSPLSRSRPRSWLRRSPSPRRYPGSYFPQLERNASSQSGFQDTSTSNPTRFSTHARHSHTIGLQRSDSSTLGSRYTTTSNPARTTTLARHSRTIGLERSGSSQSGSQVATTLNPVRAATPARYSRTIGVVVTNPSSNAPWPLREGSHALSPFSSAWPAPGSAFPTANPAVSYPAMASLSEPAFVYFSGTQLRHGAQRSDQRTIQQQPPPSSTATSINSPSPPPPSEHHVAEHETRRKSRRRKVKAADMFPLPPGNGTVAPAPPDPAPAPAKRPSSWLGGSRLRLSSSPAGWLPLLPLIG